MFSSGQLTTSAQVCREGEREWFPLAEELEEPAPAGRSFWSTLIVATGAFAVIAAGGLWFVVANAGGEISEADKATAAMRQRLNGQAPDQLWARWQEAAAAVAAAEAGAVVSPSKDPKRLEIVVSGRRAEMSDYQARKLVRDTWSLLGGKSATVSLRDDTGKLMAKADGWSAE